VRGQRRRDKEAPSFEAEGRFHGGPDQCVRWLIPSRVS
jgi:hypothetical protein